MVCRAAARVRKKIADPVTNRLFALSGNQCAYPWLRTAEQPVPYPAASAVDPLQPQMPDESRGCEWPD
jgi:hypothetical protein